MAKKRTLKPFYGKVNQRLDQAGAFHMKQGNIEVAKEFFDRSKEVLDKRRGGGSNG